MSLLGILSDTHGYYADEIDDVFKDVDLILHAGDVGGNGEIIERLRRLAPVRAVYGNVDGPPIRKRFPEHDRFEVEGLRIWMTHIGGHPGRWDRRVSEELQRDPPDVFVCGHSHILRIERVNVGANNVNDPALRGGDSSLLYVNPGAAGRQGFHQVKTCVRMAVEDGKAVSADVAHLEGQNHE